MNINDSNCNSRNGSSACSDNSSNFSIDGDGGAVPKAVSFMAVILPGS